MSFLSRSDLDSLLDVLVKEGASDLHLGVGRPPVMRRHGRLLEMPGYPYALTPADIDNVLEKSYGSASAPSMVQGGKPLDFAYDPSVDYDNLESAGAAARFRVNAAFSARGIRMVFRRLAAMPPSPADLHLPEDTTRFIASMRQGLILVTGPTGSGKSTTLAAWIRHLLEQDMDLHVLTLEHPIEYRYDDVVMQASYVTQHEIGRDFESFQVGLKNALRQDPDIILLGEMRDTETIRTALEAAETGHLVFGTVHTTDVASTVSRIVQNYPSGEQPGVRAQLINALRLVVSQRLLPAAAGGRVACREMLAFTPDLRATLLETSLQETPVKLASLTDKIGTSMRSAVTELYEQSRITEEVYRAQLAVLQEEASTLEAVHG